MRLMGLPKRRGKTKPPPKGSIIWRMSLPMPKEPPPAEDTGPDVKCLNIYLRIPMGDGTSRGVRIPSCGRFRISKIADGVTESTIVDMEIPVDRAKTVAWEMAGIVEGIIPSHKAED